jgi:hypothetical protein
VTLDSGDAALQEYDEGVLEVARVDSIVIVSDLDFFS